MWRPFSHESAGESGHWLPDESQWGAPDAVAIEGRDPNSFFSTSFYLSLNQDVKKAGVDPLVHFDQYGWQEGRQPSAAFDDAAYLAANPDVAAAHVDPLAHFLQYGESEGRQATALTSLIGPHGFDYVFYLQHNPDVQAAEVDPFQHYENFGWKEGRNPNALFDTNGYLAANPDVANAHINPLDHYDQYGWREGRDPSPAFDTTEYLSHYSDVAAAHIEGLIQIRFFRWFAESVPLVSATLRLVSNTPFREQGSNNCISGKSWLGGTIILAFSSSWALVTRVTATFSQHYCLSFLFMQWRRDAFHGCHTSHSLQIIRRYVDLVFENEFQSQQALEWEFLPCVKTFPE